MFRSCQERREMAANEKNVQAILGLKKKIKKSDRFQTEPAALYFSHNYIIMLLTSRTMRTGAAYSRAMASPDFSRT